ncbi:cytochrome b5-like heme/steroid binding domain-containing protein [Mrakia frigida]|uniref:cytochrome b5-like heme/steroid binding domain-containing protein n=1 Tax=Mrakia frigida TaxID=29902 RepID=UPI003FCC251C
MSSTLLSSTVIPLLLSLPPLYLIYTLLFPPIPARFSSRNPPPSSHHDGYTWLPLKAQESLLLKDYTPRTLEPFNGTDGKRILLALKGTVFDVSQGAQFYGPDGPYGNFAGRDASRGMAKQSFDAEMLTPVDQPLDTLADLDKGEIENMNGWMEHFTNKYVVCGRLVENESS